MRRAAAVLPLVGLLATGCGIGNPDQGSQPTGTASIAPQCAQYPDPGLTCRSPDGAWTLSFTRGPGTLWLTHRRAHRRIRAYTSSNSCCTYISWVKPHTLFFDDDYRVMRLDPATRKHTTIAGWSDFFASPDGQWLVGWASGSPEEAETVGVRSTAGATCLVVPRTASESDEAVGFTPDSQNVVVSRRPFSPNNGPTGPSHLVQYAIASLPASKRC